MLEQIVSELHRRGQLPHADTQRYFCAFNNRANINLVLFDRADERRRVFCKLSDRRNFSEIFKTMERIHGTVEDLLPEPLCTFDVGSYQLLATRAHRLDLLASVPRLDLEQQQQTLRDAIDRLIALHSVTIEGQVQLDRAYCEAHVVPMARRFFDQWPEDDQWPVFQRYLEGLLSGPPLTIPRIAQHGDLTVFNIATVDGDSRRLFFIDWDSYGDANLAGLDVVTLLTSFARIYGEGAYVRSALTPALAGEASRYCVGVGMEPQALAVLCPISWLQYAAVKLDIGVRDGQRVAYREIRSFLTQRERFVLV